MSFEALYQLDVTEYLEQKGQFAYLSWPYAVAKLRIADPTASWAVRRFSGMPYLKSECGYFVEVSVTVQGITLSQVHPVLDSRNQPIEQPNAFDINTSIQRCLVKAIALHGLGLKVYAGEDLPKSEAQPTAPQPTASVTRLPSAAPVSVAQLSYIEKLLKETGTEASKVCEFFGVPALKDLGKAAASRAIKSLESQKTRRAA